MNKIQAGRLLTLAYFLKTEVKSKNFSMHSYWNNEYPFGHVPKLKEVDCHTTACALGWGSEVFPRTFFLDECGLAVGDGMTIGDVTQNFFGINIVEESDLFYCEEKRTPKQEAKVIENFVLSKGWMYA